MSLKENILFTKFDYYQREDEANMITKIKVAFGAEQDDPEFFILKTKEGK